MAEEQEKNLAPAAAATRFRLPKLFSQGAEAGAEAVLPTTDASGLTSGSTSAAVAALASSASAKSRKNGVRLPITTSGAVQAALKEKEEEFKEREDALREKESLLEGGSATFSPDVMEEVVALRDVVEQLSEQIAQVNDREGSLERVFDALHAELADYKNDFLYEHLKPVVRPLLFLFDSLEQFDGEVAMAQATMTQEQRGGVLSPPVVRENVGFFRDQLVEALRVCEVTIMDTPQGAFNAKFHKAVDVMPVPVEEDGTIVRVVRSGWFLNGQLLRPAEIVVGKFRNNADKASTDQVATEKTD